MADEENKTVQNIAIEEGAALAAPDAKISNENKALPQGPSEDINENYNIDFGNQIKELSTEFAKAYPAAEKKFRIKDAAEPKALYALVFEKTFPARVNLINHLITVEEKDPGILPIVRAGVVQVKDATLYAAIVEQPTDRKIEEIFTGNPVPEKYLINVIMLPLAKAITNLAYYGYAHGRINVRNVYFNPVQEKVYLGDCLSEPCGFSQPLLYEAPERMLCHKLAKGDRSTTSDFYALGIIIIFLITGKEPLANVDEAKLIDMKLLKGSFNAFVEGMNIPSIFHELLRGLLSDRSDKRWNLDQIDNWVRRKANPSASVPVKESMRGFIFNETEYFSRRSLALAMERNHDKVKRSLKTGDLSRWIKHSILKPELANKFDAMQFNSRLAEPVVLDEDDIARIIVLLDTEGPMFLSGVALSIYGMGTYLAYGYAKNKREMIQVVGDFFNSGLLYFWVDATDIPEDQTDPRYMYLGWNPKKVIRMMRNPALGFGMERALYELNSSLACQSTLLNGYYVATLADLLYALDKLAEEKVNQLDPVDRHIAAFIATKIDLRDDINLRRLAEFPNMARHPQMIMLAFLVAAQKTSRVKSVRNLCNWIIERLSIPLSTLQSKTLKDDIVKNLKRYAKDGNLQNIFNYITDPNYIKRDNSSFKEAKIQYHRLSERIQLLSKQENTEKLAYEYGLRIAVIIGYVVLTSTFFYLLSTL